MAEKMPREILPEKAVKRESITIKIKKTTPIGERISKSKELLSEWMMNLEIPFSADSDIIRLNKCERTISEYIYHYVVDRDAKSLK